MEMKEIKFVCDIKYKSYLNIRIITFCMQIH